ncbi:MAG TPA: DUF1351 domain-containing protein [Bacillus bacterium]|nr:DUF1351 domain-containing protein [Bacillus sp. (in: firmicutes)]
MSTELQVKTINLTPAVVEFNFDELSAVLDEQLKKYEGLTFTEKDAAACKKTITELNKGKKALDDYRKETKKKLTESVTAFENQCKELGAKFDSVINPLKEQHDEFENQRKEEKRKQIQTIIDGLLEKEGLNGKFAAQLIIPDEYYNKGKAMKAIRDELTTKAEYLGIQQDKEDADKEIIRMTVQQANTVLGVNLPESVYFNLLDYKTVEEIRAQIQADGEKEGADRIVKVPVITTKPTTNKTAGFFKEKYQVEGTESQLDALEEWMTSHSLTWKVIEE